MNFPVAPGGPGTAQRHSPLPADVSGFVGRGDELGRLGGLLRSARLVTVAGPGGVGKTRLALRAARAAGVPCCLVELSALSDPELLADTVALRLGLRRADAGPLGAVLSELRGRRLLLVLDTCEHLAGACARFAAAVLRETSGVAILATSRQPLHVPGEEVFRLGPLPVPDGGATADGPVAEPGSAVELFAQRAAAAVSGFTLTPENLPHVVRLCRRLDGIPLAIELAAVRVRALPVAELAARVEAGVASGTGTRRGGAGRHQTLRSAIEWSYGLCTDAEKAAWRRLSVFAGTFEVPVARDVIAGDDVPAGLADAVIGDLVDKSVVLPAGAGRYRLLDSVREYGADRLAEAGEDAACRERYLARYESLAREYSRRLVSDGQQDRLARLRAEHENIRAALKCGFAGGSGDAGQDDPGDARAAARLTAALYLYWIMSGSVREGMRWQDRALSRLSAPSPERATALSYRALLAAAVGAAEAIGQASEALSVAAGAGDERVHARACLALQLALTTAGRHAEAIEAADQARWRLESLGARHALRTLDVQLALTHVHTGNSDAAIEYCQRVLRGLAPGERWLRGNAHFLLALAHYQQPGQRDACLSAAGEGLRDALDIGNVIGVAYSLEVLAWLAADAGRCQRAAWLLGAAQALWERTGGRLSGSAVLTGYHDHSVASATAALGTARFAELHAAGGARPLAQVAALALAGADVLPVLPVLPAPRTARDDGAGAGGEELTAREWEIAALVASGLSNREVAARLVISKRTVDAHVNHIFAKLGLGSRVQLTIWLRNRQTVRPPGELSRAARS